MNNKFNLVRLLGLMTLSIGFMFTIGVAPLIMKNHNEIYEIVGFLLLIGILYLIVGLCMLLYFWWMRVAASILYSFSICSVLFYFFILNDIPRQSPVLFVCFVLTICTLLFSAILFVNNEKVIAEYGRKDITDFNESDVLDNDF